jgi:hypothetical protein
VGCSFFLLLLRIFSLALPFKGGLGGDGVWCFRVRAALASISSIPAKASRFIILAKAGIQFPSSLFVSAKASHFVIPAKAGIHLLLLLTLWR